MNEPAADPGRWPEIPPGGLPDERALLDALLRIHSHGTDQEEPREALQRILGEICQVLPASSASICLINPDTGLLEIEVARGLPEDFREVQLRLGQGVTGWVALHGRPLVVADVTQEARYVPVRPEVRSEMAVPMEDRGAVVGVVNVDSERPGAFHGEHVRALILLTNEAARAVGRIWTLRQLRTQAEHLTGLINTGQQLLARRQPEEILRGIAAEAARLSPCRLCAVYLLQPDQATLVLAASAGAGEPDPAETRCTVADSALGTAILHRRPVEVHDLVRLGEPHCARTAAALGLVSLLAWPVLVEDEVIGLVNLYTDHLHRFSNDEKRILGTLAGLGAVAIQNARLYARVFASEETLHRHERLTTLGLLSAEIAHEIRNPLTVIKLLFEALDLRFPAGDPRARDLAVIGEKLDQLNEIADRVLNFGKSQEGLHSRWPLDHLLADTLHLLRLKLSQQRVQWTFTRSPHPLVVEGSKGQLQQVFLNLLLNAAQAMPEGGEIRLRTAAESGSRTGRAVILISDTGPGIPRELRERIFDSFLSGRAEGTGLGLAIVKRILRSHRGDIELLETSPAGTTFRLWLPLAGR